jgi:hypothetical protein
MQLSHCRAGQASRLRNEDALRLDHLDTACDFPWDRPSAAASRSDTRPGRSFCGRERLSTEQADRKRVDKDKNERIGTIDDLIADKKEVHFAVLQVGGFLGVGGRLTAVPYDSLVIDDKGQKITLPGATKDELKKLSEFNYPA